MTRGARPEGEPRRSKLRDKDALGIESAWVGKAIESAAKLLERLRLVHPDGYPNVTMVVLLIALAGGSTWYFLGDSSSHIG